MPSSSVFVAAPSSIHFSKHCILPPLQSLPPSPLIYDAVNHCKGAASCPLRLLHRRDGMNPDPPSLPRRNTFLLLFRPITATSPSHLVVYYSEPPCDLAGMAAYKKRFCSAGSRRDFYSQSGNFSPLLQVGRGGERTPKQPPLSLPFELYDPFCRNAPTSSDRGKARKGEEEPKQTRLALSLSFSLSLGISSHERVRRGEGETCL